eukprot:SAG11_NODE_2855_length_2904_cov_2.521925_2_plen_79_part_00
MLNPSPRIDEKADPSCTELGLAEMAEKLALERRLDASLELLKNNFKSLVSAAQIGDVYAATRDMTLSHHLSQQSPWWI